MHRSFPLQGRRLRPCFLDAHPNGRAGVGGIMFTQASTVFDL